MLSECFNLRHNNQVPRPYPCDLNNLSIVFLSYFSTRTLLFGDITDIRKDVAIFLGVQGLCLAHRYSEAHSKTEYIEGNRI